MPQVSGNILHSSKIMLKLNNLKTLRAFSSRAIPFSSFYVWFWFVSPVTITISFATVCCYPLPSYSALSFLRLKIQRISCRTLIHIRLSCPPPKTALVTHCCYVNQNHTSLLAPVNPFQTSFVYSCQILKVYLRYLRPLYD